MLNNVNATNDPLRPKAQDQRVFGEAEPRPRAHKWTVTPHERVRGVRRFFLYIAVIGSLLVVNGCGRSRSRNTVTAGLDGRRLDSIATTLDTVLGRLSFSHSLAHPHCRIMIHDSTVEFGLHNQKPMILQLPVSQDHSCAAIKSFSDDDFQTLNAVIRECRDFGIEDFFFVDRIGHVFRVQPRNSKFRSVWAASLTTCAGDTSVFRPYFRVLQIDADVAYFEYVKEVL